MSDREAAFYNLTQNCPERIYHYTSPDAFLKIISGKKIRFTRFDCLNDYSEGTLVKQLYSICLLEMLDTGEISKEFYESVKELDISSKTLVDDKKCFYRPVDTDFYVCCFSEDPDALQMWQYYSKGGNYEGYNIGFNTSSLRNAYYASLNICHVEYNEDKQKRFIKEAIRVCDWQSRKEKVLITIELQYQLSVMNICFKKACFAGEKEIRAIMDVSRSPEAKDQMRPPIEYRIGHGLMIPYFDLLFKPESIEEITIGPVTSNRDNTMEKNREVTKQFVSDKLNRPFENVKNSSIPVRY